MSSAQLCNRCVCSVEKKFLIKDNRAFGKTLFSAAIHFGSIQLQQPVAGAKLKICIKTDAKRQNVFIKKPHC